ncbi:MAG: IS66 family transposase [Verrucomicrobia bacterium]|nr:IS66 family transposase [Verrucomicrobiota bacterium]
MRAHELEREQDIEHLRRVALAMHAQIEQLVAALTRKCTELEALKGSKDELQQTLALIEKLTQQQRALATQRAAGAPPAAKTDDESPTPPRRRARSKTGPTSQLKLPVIEHVCTLPESERVCDSCGRTLDEMSGQYEESELIDVVEVAYHVKHVKRQKYRCRCGSCITTAPGPERAIAGGRYSLDVAIKIILDKYLYHLPLARQSRIMEEHGLVITPQALWDQLYAVAQRLQITITGLIEHVMAQPVIGLDQTGWPRLDSAGTKPWQMWCVTAPGAVVHRIRDDKSAATFKRLVGDYRGVIVCDALKTHEAGARASPGIVLAGCWAHCYRKFEEAEPDHPEAGRALELIGKLYEIDALADGDLVRLAELRRTESVAVLAALETWLWEQATLKTLSIGKAAAYVIANWDRLKRFIDDPRIPLDNNATERGIRGPVVGRKNYYGSKSRSGTEVASTFYSLLETAKLHDVDPREYLRAAILAADRGEALLPWTMVRSP